MNEFFFVCRISSNVLQSILTATSV